MDTLTYTSPLTGLTYVVAPKHGRRAYYENGQQLWRDEVTYEIALNGKAIQFALSLEGVAGSVAHAEGVDDGWTSSARD